MHIQFIFTLTTMHLTLQTTLTIFHKMMNNKIHLKHNTPKVCNLTVQQVSIVQFQYSQPQWMVLVIIKHICLILTAILLLSGV
jgi:hypothetical protein